MGNKAFLRGVKDKRILRAISRMIYRNPPGESFEDGYTWQEHAEPGDECLSMIRETLEAVGCCHDKSHGDSTPPMMYNDWIRCAIAKREKRIKELETRTKELEAVQDVLHAENVRFVESSGEEIERLKKHLQEANQNALIYEEVIDSLGYREKEKLQLEMSQLRGQIASLKGEIWRLKNPAT